ncbi:phage tail protein I [Caballeronia fortuita]|uniref:Phage tail protein I n=1 Tax=Caballeronia fortuita TaxID=1777138 RepID=A0A158E9P1_9BURK|nr:phage tail protein I [Caballeronia fortuita]SAL03106.1 phage tail protein I [Caballeronia fortuita]
MADITLLPPNATAQEVALEGAMARISDVPVPLRTLNNENTLALNLLPWLAWARAVNEWDSKWSESTKRAVIAASIPLHRLKGTIYSIKLALSSAGYPDAQIIEGTSRNTYNGAIQHDGTTTYGQPSTTSWAYYRVILGHPISNAQAAQVQRILRNTAPARCVLASLEFSKVAATYDGTLTYNGAFNYGIVS